jgi:SH3 domain-containing YSC84-like protein 1
LGEFSPNFLGKEERSRVMKEKNSKITGLVFGGLIGLLILGFWASAQAQEEVDPGKLLDQALVTFQRFEADKQMEWLHQNLKNAKGVLIVPSLVKLGFFLGGAGGEAVLLARDEKSGEWSQPVFYSLGHVSFGLQLGGEKQEVLMVIRTDKALAGMREMDFKLGGETSMAAGPIGGGVSGTIKDDIVSFSYSKGAFAGVAFEGAVLKVNSKANRTFYGREAGTKEILILQSVSNPVSEKMRKALEKASK